MKSWLTVASVAALVTVAACNGGDPAPAPENQAEAAENVAAGAGTPTDIAAVMRARHEHYEEMGDAMKGLGRELKASSPSVETIQRHAALIAGYGPQILTWFPEGSGPEAGETRAKAEIWSDAATFRERAQAFEAVSARFNQTAQTGNLDAIRAGMGELGNACKNCHDRFRAPED
ncbi:c-type cytochrome [Sphingosinicella terrae]|uniref:c-type cytochrome n=1 Tax=Sphingosinicella terrae TaxID=2172047 RepID=UPI002546B1AB|nr:cytochrome c [Sphingosinicella terrae]